MLYLLLKDYFWFHCPCVICIESVLSEIFSLQLNIYDQTRIVEFLSPVHGFLEFLYPKLVSTFTKIISLKFSTNVSKSVCVICLFSWHCKFVSLRLFKFSILRLLTNNSALSCCHRFNQ